ncbi:MAG: pyridoxal phosphate-dependent aminotransferase family protein, partial [bacterium]|nr:pyridoxal phosphate-dependent aminotransferase family protein [bacterium]
MRSTLKERTRLYQDPNFYKEKGIYPFFREINSEQGTEVEIYGKKVLMFGSNSYLGLTNHPYVKEAAEKALRTYGSGCAGSRFLNGTIDLHVELENRLASFLNKEGCIVFSTGFQVNLGVIPAITQRGDYILLDRLNHASIIEGSRLSQADALMYRHNDMKSLENKLKHCP